MAHLHRRFTAQILARICQIPLEKAKSTITTLSQLSFIKHHKSKTAQEDSYVLHDEMRVLIIKYLLKGKADYEGGLREQWNQAVIAYYDDVIDIENIALERRHLERERLYYLLQISVAQGFDYWLSLLSQVSSYELREALNTEFEAFFTQLNRRIPPEQQDRLHYEQADVAYARGHYAKALEILDELLQQATPCSIELQAMSRAQRIMVYTLSGEATKALELAQQDQIWFDDILKTEPGTFSNSIQLSWGKFNNNVGYAYRNKSQIRDAEHYYEKALSVYSKLPHAKAEEATTRTNLAYICDFLGKDKIAFVHCQRALRIKQQLNQPYELGLSYNVMGILEFHSQRMNKAFDYYDKALEEFKKAKSRRGEALSFIAYGKALRESGWQKVRPERGLDLAKAVAEYTQASQHFNNAIRILENTDKGNLADAHHERGILLREQAQWDRAITDFNISILEAEHNGNNHLIAANLKDLAVTYQLRGEKQDIDKALNYAIQAITKGRESNSVHVTSRAQRVAADIYLLRKEYSRAFDAIAKSITNVITIDPNSTENPATKSLFYLYWQEWLQDIITSLPGVQKEACKTHLLAQWPTDKPDYDSFIATVEMADD